MNDKIDKRIVEYYSIISTWYSKYKKKHKITESMIQERMMRIGNEAKVFEADDMDTLRYIAVMTLQKDYIKYLIEQPVEKPTSKSLDF